jgi:hypothetical protein
MPRHLSHSSLSLPFFGFDNPHSLQQPPVLSEGSKPLVSKKDLVIDAILTVAAFVLFYWVARSHVPSNAPGDIRLWAAITSSCMTAVFWMAWQLLRVVYRRQKETSGK